MTLRDKLFSFDGRLRRMDWWIWGIVMGLLWVAAGAVVTRLIFSGAVDLDQVVFSDPAPVFATAVALHAVYLWPTSALYAKRAHDLNWPAWPVIVLMLVVVAAPYFPYDLTPAFSSAPASGMEIAVTAMTCIFVVAWVVAVFMLAFIDGAPGPNRFGPSPKALSEGAPAFIAPGGVE